MNNTDNLITLEFGQSKFNLYDLTIPINKYGAFRGGRLPFIQRYDVPYRPHTASSIFFSIHTGTHFDLPWGLDWRNVELARIKHEQLKLEKERKIETIEYDFINNLLLRVDEFLNQNEDFKSNYIENISKPTIKECIVLDFVKLFEQFENFLEDFDDFTIDPKYLKVDLPPEKFKSLHELLTISEGNILSLVKKEEISNKIVIIKTGWDYYYPFYSNHGHTMWEAWHSYLTNPFLDISAIQCLLKNGAIGIASDTVCLDDPLFYLEPVSQFVQQYIRDIYKKGFFENMLSFRPVHVAFLSNCKYVIENLTNIDSIQAKSGYLWIDPLSTGTDDALPTKIYFIPKR